MKKNHCVVLILLSLPIACETDQPTPDKPVPASPIDLMLNSVSDVEISLSWTDNSTNEDGFVIERKVGNEGFKEYAYTERDEASFSDRPVQANNQYSYRVYAFNSGGKSESYTNVVTANTLPTISVLLTTLPATFVGTSSALSGGLSNPNASPPVTARGIVWNTSVNPTITLPTKTIDQPDVHGEFQSLLNGLSAGTTYYIRAYATSVTGTTYGNQVSFTSLAQPFSVSGSGVTDADGTVYPTLIIGSQEWLGENLRTTKFSDGTAIAKRPDDGSGIWWYYDNNHPSIKYGNYYNMAAIKDPKNVCPTGWHVPTNDEWAELADALGGMEMAGARLRATNSDWASPPATNESGFNALPARSFYWYPNSDKNAVWWTVTPSYSNQNYVIDMYDHSTSMQIASNSSSDGSAFNVRCLKD